MKAIDLKVGDKITSVGSIDLVGIITEIVSIKGKIIRVEYKPIQRKRRFKNETIEPDERHRVNYNINTPLENIIYK